MQAGLPLLTCTVAVPASAAEDDIMPAVLVPVDGSENSLRAATAACRLVADRPSITVHLLNVQPANHSGIVAAYLDRELIERFHRTEGERVLQAAIALVESSGISCTSHIELGDVAPTIARYADAIRCEQVVMGTRGLGSSGLAALSGLLLGSIATKVLQLVDVPVTLVK